ncbi:hypothetical protein GCM10009543_40060 [Leifsonia naganoensis]
MWATPAVRSALAIDAVLTVFALPTALLPAMNSELLDGRPETLGLLMSCLSVGGIAASVFSGPISSAKRLGYCLVGAGAVWGLLALLLGFSTDPVVSAAVLVLIGAADLVASVLGQSIIQISTPDEYRGRVSGIEHLVQMGGPQLGSMRAGSVAAAFGSAVSLVVGGAVAVAGLTVLVLTHAEAIRRVRTDEGARDAHRR